MRQTSISEQPGARCVVKTTVGRTVLTTAGALAAALTFVAPAQAASIGSRVDICAALRNGTSLASIEAALEARGYSGSDAGRLTGVTIRQQCPDQAANAIAQARKAQAFQK